MLSLLTTLTRRLYHPLGSSTLSACAAAAHHSYPASVPPTGQQYIASLCCRCSQQLPGVCTVPWAAGHCQPELPLLTTVTRRLYRPLGSRTLLACAAAAYHSYPTSVPSPGQQDIVSLCCRCSPQLPGVCPIPWVAVHCQPLLPLLATVTRRLYRPLVSSTLPACAAATHQ